MEEKADCITGYVASITPVPPLTAPGGQDVAALMAGLAKQMGLAFINRGVSAAVRNPAFVGGPMDQARQLADAARISLIVDDGEMVIAPPGELRSDDGGSTPVWNRETGMLGYPGFDNEGVVVKGIYEPKLQIGAPCALKHGAARLRPLADHEPQSQTASQLSRCLGLGKSGQGQLPGR